MFDTLVLHPTSYSLVEHYVRQPSAAALLTGPPSIGKHQLARSIASVLLGIPLAKLDAQGMYREISSDKPIIDIEQIRQLSAFFALKTTGNQQIRRVVVIPDAERMNLPAQNALLKMLEEPPDDSVILLTSSAPSKLLPTITSRTRTLNLAKPPKRMVYSHFSNNYTDAEIESVFTIARGNIGTMELLLKTQADSNYMGLPELKRILGLNMYDQLLLVETTLKDKAVAKQFTQQLSRIASASLLESSDPAKARQWRRISNASYIAESALAKNANSKLVLTELFLSLRG